MLHTNNSNIIDDFIKQFKVWNQGFSLLGEIIINSTLHITHYTLYMDKYYGYKKCKFA